MNNDIDDMIWKTLGVVFKIMFLFLVMMIAGFVLVAICMYFIE
jgi:hypothetical protein